MAGLETWVKTNGWGIICTVLGGAATLYSGYLTGQTTTAGEIAGLRQDVVQLRREMDTLNRVKVERGRFMACAVRSIDHINTRLGINPPCALDITE